MRGLFCGKFCKRHLVHSLNRRICYSTSSPVNVPDIPKVYDAASTEKINLAKWDKVKSRQCKDPKKPVFRMVLPPPNVTGKLHLGHFLTIAIEDTLARWRFMSGANVEWIPGFDHAGIATQSVVNRKLSKQSGPVDVETSLKTFATENLTSIRDQLKVTGALLDWDKTYYTLDDKHSSIVNEAFVQLFESGLIKRTGGIVNWSCALKTSVADIEVDSVDFEKRISLLVPNYEEPIEFGVLYFISYPLLHSDQETITVATSRPETMFGDVALAVNPADSRFVDWIGKRVVNPVNGSVIPVIGDPRVKPDFGTGVVKVTPAHDKLDFVIGTAQKLEAVQTFTEDGFLNEKCGDFQGISRFTARKKILSFLNEKGSIVQEKSYAGSLNVCSRTGDVIEPRIIPHWYLQTQFLSNKLIQAINDKSFIIVPDNHAKSLIHKLADSQDWCLSRQIKWGHRIPAFHHKDFPDKWVSGRNIDEAISKLERQLGTEIDSSHIVQDPDVLDTWFSSALIPLSISGWPDSENFKEITLMETGHDILLFWVWRMTIMTLALVDRFPFRHVLLHGIVTDHYGRKMSKSKGNVIDPLHIINGISCQDLIREADNSFASGELDEHEYKMRKSSIQRNLPSGISPCGTDALRITLLSQNIFDQQMNMDLSYLDNCKRFTNKLWQALRFLKIHSSNLSPTSGKPSTNETACKWLLACLYEFNKSSENALNQAKFHLYAEAVRKFFYQDMCDIYIELVKTSLRDRQDISKFVSVMEYAFETGLKISHPLIPFVSEEIWSFLRRDKESCLLEQEFPVSKDLEHFNDPALLEAMRKSTHLISEIRGSKKRGGWVSKEVPTVKLVMDSTFEESVKPLASYIEGLAGCTLNFEKLTAAERGTHGTYLVEIEGHIVRIHIPMLDQARSANEMKIEKLKLKLMKLQQQIQSPAFQEKAPEATKKKLKTKVENLILQLNEISETSNPTNSSN